MIKIFLPSSKIDNLLEDIGFDIVIKQSKLAKKMSLKVDAKSRMPVLTLPKLFSKKLALEFVKKNQGWIEAKINAMPKEKVIKCGDVITLFGKDYEVICSSDLISSCKIEGDFLYTPTDEKLLHSRVIRFIKTLAKKKLTDLSLKKAKIIGGVVNNVVIKDTKSRWGSCSIKGNINYNFRLAFAPNYVSNAIVCHEVCHLIHHNHGEDFYNLLYSICPDYDKAEGFLKHKSKELYEYK